MPPNNTDDRRRDTRRDSDDRPRSEPKPDQRPERREPRGNDKPVVGLGDHLPGFIAQSFDERRTG